MALVGIVLGIIGVTMTTSNPQAAKTCTMISYILFGIGFALMAVLFVLYGATGLMAVMAEGA